MFHISGDTCKLTDFHISQCECKTLLLILTDVQMPLCPECSVYTTWESVKNRSIVANPSRTIWVQFSNTDRKCITYSFFDTILKRLDVDGSTSSIMHQDYVYAAKRKTSRKNALETIMHNMFKKNTSSLVWISSPKWVE